MKYNEDIHPIKKQIGLDLEKYLESYTNNILDGYKYLTIDRYYAVFLWKEKPETRLNTWSTNFLSRVKNIDFIITKKQYTSKQLDYIKNNWKDLIFELGEKQND